MPGPVIGSAVIVIGADASGFDRDLSNQTNKAGDSAGKSSGDILTKSMGTALKAGAVAVGAGLGATVGIGFSTAMESEVAKMKFTQLFKGQVSQAEGFIEQLKSFAARTPFEFPGLQDAASRFLAVGIEASRVIPIMTNLGNVTSIMGTGEEGIKRATVALQQMATRGKVTGEELMQLSEAGIPALKLLSESLGVPVEKLQDMVSKGLVPADAMFKALESTTSTTLSSFTGGMDKMSQTTTGKLSTLKDNFSQFAGRIVDDALPAVNGFVSVLSDDVVPWLEDAAETVKGLGEKLSGIVGFFQENEVAARSLGVVLGGALALITAAWVAQGVVATIEAAKSVAAWFATATASTTSATIQSKSTAQIVVGWVAAGASAILHGAVIVAQWAWMGVQALLHAAKVAAAWLIAMGPIGLVIAAVVGLVAIIVLNFDKIKEWIGKAWEWVKEKTTIVWEAITGFFTHIWSDITNAVSVGLENIKGWLSTAWEWIKDKAATAWEAIKWIILGPVGAIARLIWENWETIKGWLSAAWEWIKGRAEDVWNGILSFFTGIWERIKSAHDAAIEWLKSLLSTAWENMKRNLSEAWERIRGALNAAWDAIKQGVSERINGVITFVRELPGKAVEALGNIKDLLVQKGRDVIQGLWDGMTEIWNKVTGWIGGIVSWIKEHKGPLSLDKKLLTPAGQAIMRGFEEGLESGKSPILRGLRSFTGEIGTIVAGRVAVGGKMLDLDTFQKITAALGSKWRLNQGSWSTSVAASAGTHAGSGVADLTPLGIGWQAAEALLRAKGLIAWFRNWVGNLHIHLVNPAVQGLSRQAAAQVQSWLRGGNGLAYASGTSSARRGWGLVGEEGPEWVRFRGGERVLPNGTTPATTVNVALTVAIDDLAKLGKLSDFLDMIDRARLDSRRTARSGMVTA